MAGDRKNNIKNLCLLASTAVARAKVDFPTPLFCEIKTIIVISLYFQNKKYLILSSKASTFFSLISALANNSGVSSPTLFSDNRFLLTDFTCSHIILLFL